MRSAILSLVLLLPAIPAAAEQWELGATAGYGVYRNGSITANAGTATAGIQNRFTVGAFVTDHMYEHLSGEVRYSYQDGGPFLSGAKGKINAQGKSHTFHYDMLFHFKDRAQRFRPYVAVGTGVKLFVVNGPVPVSQPLSQIGILASRDQARLVISGGAGISYQLRKHIVLRADFRDYITPFPKKILAPAAGATARGIFHQFTPSFGIGYSF